VSKPFIHQFFRTLFALALGLGILGGNVHARETATPHLAAPQIKVALLPPQGQTVYALIAKGGPFKYDKDGVVFGNRERQLPAQKRGYYREYTVPTPGSRDRGARRIVCGGLQVQSPDRCYYTDDHYASFKQIVD
jgi:ribonuclease T1